MARPERFELLTLVSQSNGERGVAGVAIWLSSCGRWLVPALRKAVAEQNKRALALLDDIQADAVGLDDPLDRFAHDPRPTKA